MSILNILLQMFSTTFTLNPSVYKYSETILKRYYIAFFNKTLSFQKLLHIDSKCH